MVLIDICKFDDAAVIVGLIGVLKTGSGETRLVLNVPS